MEFDYLTMPKTAVTYLADALKRGVLVLILGAGVSIGEGLPDWVELVHRLRTRAGLPFDQTVSGISADELQLAVDEVFRDYCKKDKKHFARLVRESLYDGVTLTSELLRSELLIALGLLMMGSRRGSVRRVVSFNFDSILEWYISLCGFVPRVVVNPPALEGAEDVRIYHPNGFLPHPDQNIDGSEFVILTSDSINLRLGTSGDEWFELVRHLLRTSVCLFVGMSVRSFRDRGLAPLLLKVGDELRDSRPTGFWLLPGSMDAKINREFLSSHVIPLTLDGYGDVPKFLLSICKEAAADVIV